MNEIRLNDLTFEIFLTAQHIRNTVDQLAHRLETDYKEKHPVFLVVLNGAFIFAADLVRRISIPLQVDFVKLSSYTGTETAGKVQEHFLWQIPLRDRHVVIVEDIVDRGHTLHYLKNKINKQQPASLEVVCLLKKSLAYEYQDKLKYEGLAIPNDFVVGYGLDYDGLGRHLESIYRKKEG